MINHDTSKSISKHFNSENVSMTTSRKNDAETLKEIFIFHLLLAEVKKENSRHRENFLFRSSQFTFLGKLFMLYSFISFSIHTLHNERWQRRIHTALRASSLRVFQDAINSFRDVAALKIGKFPHLIQFSRERQSSWTVFEFTRVQFFTKSFFVLVFIIAVEDEFIICWRWELLFCKTA